MLQLYREVTVLPVDVSKWFSPDKDLKSCHISPKGIIKLVGPVLSGLVYSFLKNNF